MYGGWEDGSVGRVVPVHAWGLVFQSLSFIYKLIPEGCGDMDPGVSLASQSSWNNELWFWWENLCQNQKKVESKCGRYSELTFGLHMNMCRWTHTFMHTHTD